MPEEAYVDYLRSLQGRQAPHPSFAHRNRGMSLAVEEPMLRPGKERK
jgi:hypothetical protein